MKGSLVLISLTLIIVGTDRGAAIQPTRMTATVQTMEQAYGSSTKPLPCDVNGQLNE